MNDFQPLGLCPEILKALQSMGFTQPTAIQAKAIPSLLEGKDLLGSAQTGTGKTAAFVMPVLQQLQEAPTEGKSYPRVLVLTPTRELALQVADNFRELGQFLPFRSTTIYGGVKQGKQVKQLQKGVDAIVATPGRLLDLMGQGYVDLSGIEHLILDEADQMLDMGFIHDLKRIIKEVPKERQTLLFSATVDKKVKEVADQFMHNPEVVVAEQKAKTADTVQQELYFVEKSNKKALLIDLLNQYGEEQSLVFTRTKREADRLARDLSKKGFKTSAIHGNKSQNQRQKTLKQFKAGKVRIMLATDVASRGLDIKELPLVINYKLPESPEVYVHRIGRTGRAGESGLAVSLCQEDEWTQCKDIRRQDKTGRIQIISGHGFENATTEGLLGKTDPKNNSGSSPSGSKKKGKGGRRRKGGSKNYSKGHSKKRKKNKKQAAPQH